MKLTLLIRLGLFTSTTFSLAAALSACDSGDEPGADGANTGSTANLGQSGSQGGPLGNGGSANNAAGVANGVSGSNGNGGMSSQAGNGNGTSGSANGGSANGEPCTNLPPNNGDTCEHALEYGWCTQDWLGESCKEACGKCSNGTSGTGSGGTNSNGGSGNTAGTASSGGFGNGGGQPPVIEGGTQGFATRYWDCCKPHCAWKGNAPGGNAIDSCNKSDQNVGQSDADNACQNANNGVYMCHDFSPWAVSDKLAYGFAAVKNSGDSCGKCYQLQFNGSSHSAQNDAGSQALNGKTMIVQAINVGNDLDQNQFDLLIPGGGVGQFDACSSQWGSSDLGERYGGFYLECQKKNGYKYAESRSCAAQKCQSVFSGKPELLAGCNFFVNWLAAPDNPNLVYKEVTCPAAITAQSGMKR